MSDSDTVTLTRAEYDALLQQIEEAEDLAAVAAAEAREAIFGKEAARADHLPIELVERLFAGEHPVRVWRTHRGLTREGLAAAAGVSPSYLTEVETGRKPGSLDVMIKLTAALRVPLDDIAAWLKSGATSGKKRAGWSGTRPRGAGG
jgi:DNA-binding XRE family transcriptional regulator